MLLAAVLARLTPHAHEPLQAVNLKQHRQKQGARLGCYSINPAQAKEEWCAEMCANVPPNCPSDMCACPEASILSIAGRPDLVPPEPRIIGGWTNCPEVALNGEVINEATDYLTNFSHQLCRKEEEGGGEDEGHVLGEESGNMPPATREWGPSYRTSWGANAILPGRFGKDEVAPIDAGRYRYRWVTVGGQGTDSANWQDTAEQDIINSKAHGCAFDEEGGVNASGAKPWIKEMRSKHKDWTFMYVPPCGAKIEPYDPENGGCDYIAPMMYNSNHDSYPRMDLSIKPESPFITDCMMMVHRAGWPAARVILTYQSFDAYRTKKNSKLMHLLGKLMGNHSITLPGGDTLQGPYAGVLGWPAQCGAGDMRCWPAADKANLQEVLRGKREANLPDSEKEQQDTQAQQGASPQQGKGDSNPYVPDKPNSCDSIQQSWCDGQLDFQKVNG
jgi:hypothetical protein